jgi:phosphatidylserine decarboxylase
MTNLDEREQALVSNGHWFLAVIIVGGVVVWGLFINWWLS